MESLSREAAARTLYRFACDSRDYAVIALDLEGRVTWWSPGAESVLGHRAADIVGQTLARLFTPEDLAVHADRQEREIALRVGSAEDDRWQVRADGSRLFASGVLTALHDDTGAVVGFVKTLRDRTDFREQIERLRNDADESRDAARRMDAFLGTLSHELRNPLAPLANAAALIRMGPGRDPTVDHALQVIDRQVAVLKRLVDDLLEMTRVGVGKVALDLKEHDLRDLLSLAVAGMRAREPGSQPAVELLLPAGPLRVEADGNRLQQVFANLLGNALKFTPPGGHVWIKATLEADEAVVRFEDDGAGIPPQMLPHLFKLFTQAEETRRMSPQGLGIGLALVRQLVELHGGSVQVRSEGLGKGSEFTVRLPARRGKDG